MMRAFRLHLLVLAAHAAHGVSCGADHNTSAPCCGQKGKPVDIDLQCHTEAPFCTGYELGVRYGTCRRTTASRTLSPTSPLEPTNGTSEVPSDSCSIHQQSSYERCSSDGEYFWCECKLCTLERNCTSNSGLFQCACPSGTVIESSALFVEVPFSARWWRRFSFMDALTGIVGIILNSTVFMLFVQSLREFHAGIKEHGCNRKACMKRGTSNLVAPWLIPFLFAAFCGTLYFSCGSGPVGFFISILFPLLFVSLWMFQRTRWLPEEEMQTEEMQTEEFASVYSHCREQEQVAPGQLPEDETYNGQSA